MTELRARLACPYAAAARQRCDVFVPEQPLGEALVALLPGGWWSEAPPVGRALGREDLRPLALRLAELGFAVAIVGHRQLGEAGCPDGETLIRDAVTGIAAACEEACALGLPAAGVCLVGSGSGSLVALNAARALPLAIPLRALAACGVTPSLDPADGLSAALARTAAQFAGTTGSARLSPLHQPAGCLAPTLLLHGDADTEVPVRAAQRLHPHLGVDAVFHVLAGGGHHLFETGSERVVAAALDLLVPFLRDHVRTGAQIPIFAGRAAG